MRVVTKSERGSLVGFALLIALNACGTSGVGGPGAQGQPGTSLPDAATDGHSSIRPALAVESSSAPLLAYVTKADGVAVLRWSGSSWAAFGGGAVPVASAGFQSVTLQETPSGLVVGTEEWLSGVADVRAYQFDGSTWHQLGASINPSGVPAHSPRLVYGPRGLLAGFQGGSPNTQAYVSRWTGTAWQAYPATTSLNAEHIELTALPSGDPAVSWSYPIKNPDGSTDARVATRVWNSASSIWTSLPDVNPHGFPVVSGLTAASDGHLYQVADAPNYSLGISTMGHVMTALPTDSAWTDLGIPSGATGLATPVVFAGQSVLVGLSQNVYGGIANLLNNSWTTKWSVPSPVFSLVGLSNGTAYAAWYDLNQPAAAAPLKVSFFK